MMHKIQTTEEAFMSMAKRNEALIYRVCLSFTRQRHDEVQDLKQEILCNLWRGYGGFRQGSSEATWIYKVALNTGLQYYRKLPKSPFTTQLTTEMAETFVDEDDQKELARMYELIHQLDEDEQKLVFMYLDDASGKEMAQVLGISEANIRTRLHRIKEKLKKMVHDGKE